MGWGRILFRRFFSEIFKLDFCEIFQIFCGIVNDIIKIMANVTVVRTLTENEVYSELATKTPLLMPITTLTSSNGLQLSNAGKMILLNGSYGVIYVTVPAEADVNFPIGTQIVFLQVSSTPVIFSRDYRIQLKSSIGLKLRGIYSSATLIKIASDSWVIVGDLIPQW